MTVNLIVTLQSKPGQMDALKPAIAELVAASQGDEGRISYRAAYADDGVTAYIVEVWRDDASLDAHQKAPHFTKGVKILQDTCSLLQIHRVHWIND